MNLNSIHSSIKKQFSFSTFNKNRQEYSINIYLKSNLIEINIIGGDKLSNYEASLKLEDFYIINKLFKQFDSIEEIYDFIVGLENIEDIAQIEIEEKFASLIISLPVISKGSKNQNIIIRLSSFNINKNEIMNILIEKEKEIQTLKEKVDFLMKKVCLPGEFEHYKEAQNIFNRFSRNSQIIESAIDFVPILIGVKKKLNKTISSLKLLFRASRDGDSCRAFHVHCNGKENTVILVKDRNGRRFGGFANQEWNSDGKWICDTNSFLFSLDHHECYFYNNISTKGKILYCAENYGPLFGEGYDLYVCDNCFSNKNEIKQYSYDYKGKKHALCGSNGFFVEDYEVYQLVLK